MQNKKIVKKQISLDGQWTLYYHPERNGKPDLFDETMLHRWTSVPAVVPGNVEIDLVRGGAEKDPFYGDRLHDYSKYEYYQWVYCKDVHIPSDFEGERIVLRFEGIDTIADVYLNGEKVGRSENMFIRHDFDVTEHLKKGDVNQIRVHIHSAMNFARSKEYTMYMRGTGHRNEICWIRKAPHCFGWDIAPRLVSAGLWRGVSLVSLSNTRITETYYATPRLEGDGIWLQYAYRFVTDADTLEGFQVRIKGCCGNSVFSHEAPAHFVSANHMIFVPNPLLWWPRGYGEQPLYYMTMELVHHGQTVDCVQETIGLRTFRLERDFNPHQQEFKMFVNETPIFAKGTNWVPLDALHSRDAQRLQKAHDLCVEAGCNIIRCWGGNVYEDHAFFDLCDQEGIMVWQDFAMGNTNYPQTDDFVKVMEEEAKAVIGKLRNHPSLILWSSDNEVDYKNLGYMYPGYDSRHNRVAQETLKRLVQAHDPYRLLICSSPEIPAGFSTDNIPEQHTWGVRAWYKDEFYKNSSARFISEAGYHGCPCVSSLEKFIPWEHLWPFSNHIWAMHSTEDIRIEKELNSRNILMANQVKIMFGEIPEDIEEFSILSQLSQAEAMKFFVERTRGLKWERTGIIWWNMLDCWPQISDAVVDYYFEKKIAFHYLKRVQAPVLVFMSEQEGWNHSLLISNDTGKRANISFTISDGDTGETVVEGERSVPSGENLEIQKLFVMPGEQKLFLIKWFVEEKAYGNHYITGFPPYDKEKMLRWLSMIKKLI